MRNGKWLLLMGLWSIGVLAANLCFFGCQTLDESQSQNSPIELSKYKQLSVQELNSFAIDATKWLKGFAQEYTTTLANPIPSCADEKNMLTYIKALSFVNGDATTAVEQVKTCLSSNEPSNITKAWLAFIAANLARGRQVFLPNDIDELFSQALSFSGEVEELHALMVTGYADWLITTYNLQKATDILAQHTQWSADEQQRIMGLLFITNGIVNHLLSENEAEEAINQQNTPLYYAVFQLNWMNYLGPSYRFKDAIKFFIDHQILSNVILNLAPNNYLMTIYRYLFSANAAVYYKEPWYSYSIDFTVVRDFYNVYLPYANFYSEFALAENPYTYTELYNEVCRDTLTQGEWYGRYKQILADFAQGKGSLPDIRSQAEKLRQDLVENGDTKEKADLLTLLGGLNELEEKYREAIFDYWTAHQVCPNYERAHAGLQSAYNLWVLSGVSFSQDIDQQTAIEIKDIEFPPSLSSYIPSFDSLNQSTQNKIKYAIKPFVSYLNDLIQKKQTMLIRHAFQLTSDLPGYEELRDFRVQNYEGDGRLDDDVEGFGGAGVRPAMVSISEIQKFVTAGGGLILTHEMAHMLHQVLFSNEVTQCLLASFQQAIVDTQQGKTVFASPYAQNNEYEYFAVGASIYAISPEMNAVSGGINFDQDWLKQHDPILANILEQIVAGKTMSDDFHCPL